MPQTFDLTRNHFDLFGIAPGFAIDLPALDSAYRGIQNEVHPDKFAHLPAAEQRIAMQWATHVNEAYRTLKSPQARAKYLLELKGEAADEHGSAGLPPAFLMEQMEWREQVEAARDAGDSKVLAELDEESRSALKAVHAELARTLDREGDNETARQALFRLMFLDKLREEIGDALESMDTA
jgi:molecular chaperone HscB